jgi:hypothetical protein
MARIYSSGQNILTFFIANQNHKLVFLDRTVTVLCMIFPLSKQEITGT